MKQNNIFYTTILVAVASFVAPNLAFAKDNIVILEGRQILLEENGGWRYISKDRYATTRDGRQVILRDNGKWKYVEKHEEIKAAPVHMPIKSSGLAGIQLQKAVLESILKKKGKRTTIKTQSVFFIDINHASDAQNIFKLDNSDKNNISVTDDKNNTYKVLAIQPGISLQPGETASVQIRIDGSPSILNRVTYMYVNFLPALNGISKKTTVKARLNDFIQESVQKFSY